MNKKIFLTGWLVLAATGSLFAADIETGGATPATVKKVDESANIATVQYKDPDTGQNQRMDVALAPSAVPPKSPALEINDLKKGDKVVVNYKEDPKTGMGIMELIKAKPERNKWQAPLLGFLAGFVFIGLLYVLRAWGSHGKKQLRIDHLLL